MSRYCPPLDEFKTTIKVPGDKSISHRSVIFNALAKGSSRITGYLCSEDCLSTLKCLMDMGVEVTGYGEEDIILKGQGFVFKKPETVLNMNNSGTGFRLMCGVLSSQDFEATLTGDESLCKRPMDRIVTPLSSMGASFVSEDERLLPPLKVKGGSLKGIAYDSPIASAQVKSAVLLAALAAKGETVFTEPAVSRDHTERMLEYFGIKFDKEGNKITISGEQKFEAKDIRIPGDISSAAFFMVLTLLKKDSELTIENVGLNPTRIGIIEVLKRMGGDITVKVYTDNMSSEPAGDIVVKSSKLTGIVIDGEIIPNIIDEIPIIALAAAYAEGETVVADAKELRVKESDRIDAVVSNFKKAGVAIEEKPDGFIVTGGNVFKRIEAETFYDHRIAMTMAIAGAVNGEGMDVMSTECVDTSFPGFFDIMEKLKKL